MKRRLWFLLLVAAAFIVGVAVLMLTAEHDQAWEPWHGPQAERDLDDMAKDSLRLLVLRDPLVWEPGPQGELGLAIAWAKRFARHRHLSVKVVPVSGMDSLLAGLWQGRGDLVLAPINPSGPIGKHFAFGPAMAQLAPMVALLRPEAGESPGLATLAPLVDSISLAANTPFMPAQYRFHHDFARRALVANDRIRSEDSLLDDVLLGRVPAAVVSDARARLEAQRLPALQFLGPVGAPVPWAFAVRPKSKALLGALAGWLADEREAEACRALMQAHQAPVPPPGPLRARRMKGVHADSISPFDGYFREHAEGLSFDWRLLAAMAWKESRFDSTVTSRKGAMGIMQMMPRTAERFGLDTASATADHVRAAAEYLARLDTLWRRAVPEKEQRLRFVLASYNAGPAHIIDAQRLAAQLGLDPERWEHHVERAVLLLAKPAYFMRSGIRNGYCKGSQVFHYVRGVLAVHEQMGGQGRMPKTGRKP
jgi:membrane-bound lytic murein transglycosylase F